MNRTRSPNGTCWSPLQNLSNTLFMLPPFSMEMTLVWSSSFTQIRKVFSLLCLQDERMTGLNKELPGAMVSLCDVTHALIFTLLPVFGINATPNSHREKKKKCNFLYFKFHAGMRS